MEERGRKLNCAPSLPNLRKWRVSQGRFYADARYPESGVDAMGEKRIKVVPLRRRKAVLGFIEPLTNFYNLFEDIFDLNVVQGEEVTLN